MECNYPTIPRILPGGRLPGNRKIFVRIRIPRGMTTDYKIVVHSLTTQRGQQGGGALAANASTENTVTEILEGAPLNILTIDKRMKEKYLLLIADETGGGPSRWAMEKT